MDVVNISFDSWNRMFEINSCAEIPQGKIRGFIVAEKKKYICVGTMSSAKDGNISCWGSQIVPIGQFDGIPCGYWDKKEKYSYNGVKVQHKGIEYVITGPKMDFKPINKNEQLNLFT